MATAQDTQVASSACAASITFGGCRSYRYRWYRPGPRPAADQEGVNRSQVVTADEDGCWAVLAGQLQRLAVKVDPVGGLTLASSGSQVLVGEPLHRPQTRGGQAVIVTRLGQAGAVQATAFDLADVASSVVRLAASRQNTPNANR